MSEDKKPVVKLPELLESISPYLQTQSELGKIANARQQLELATRAVVGDAIDPKSVAKRIAEFFDIIKNPKQAEKFPTCSPRSLIASLAVAAINNYSLSGGAPHAYLIPYGKEISVQLSYHGLVRSRPNIQYFEWFVQHTDEVVVEAYVDGSLVIKERKIIKDRAWAYGGKDFQAVYGRIVYIKGGKEFKTQWDCLTKIQVERLRKMNRGQKDQPSDAWWSSYNEMAMVKLFRKMLKTFTTGGSTEAVFEDAIYTIGDDNSLQVTSYPDIPDEASQNFNAADGVETSEEGDVIDDGNDAPAQQIYIPISEGDYIHHKKQAMLAEIQELMERQHEAEHIQFNPEIKQLEHTNARAKYRELKAAADVSQNPLDLTAFKAVAPELRTLITDKEAKTIEHYKIRKP